MNELTEWDKTIIKEILSWKNFKFKEVNNFKSVKSMIFKTEEYPSIISLISEQNWECLESIGNLHKEGFGEYLDIVKFSDENNNIYAATIYDSDELWQDPQIIDIISLS